MAVLFLAVPGRGAGEVRWSQELREELAPPGGKPAATSTWHKVRGSLRTSGRALVGFAGGLHPLAPATTSTGRLRVVVRLRDTMTVPAELREAGLEIERGPVAGGLIQGTVDPGDLLRLAGVSQVAWIGPLDVPIHRIGSVTTEGDGGSGADVVRQQGLDGTGVTVGVISDGIDGLAEARASDDLDAVVVPRDTRCRRGNGAEGTALLEIVHDLAPRARLLFSGVASSVDMIDAVACLAAAGADVIVDDLGFPLEPYFEDGPVAEAVRAAVATGVSYHTAAGNEAEEYLETDFRPSPSTRFHDFNVAPGGAVDNSDSIVVAPGAVLQCVLQWSDRFGASGNDYDLYLLDDASEIIAAGSDVQDGDDDPVEVAAVINPSAVPQTAHVAIEKFVGETRRLKLLCFGGDVYEYVTPEGSIFGHQALPEVVTVGAVDQAEPDRDRIETFSSRGPVRILHPTDVSRPKPDLAALDGVSISNAAGFPLCPPFCRFFGTSAAVPHTAGVAALMLQKVPGLSPGAVLSALQQGATDIESPGFDSLAGAGLLNAVESVALVHLVTTTTSSTVTTTSTTSTTVANASCAQPCADDGDACTSEQCAPGTGCRSIPIERAQGVVCLMDGLLRARQCDRSQISARVARMIGRKALKARAHASRSIGAPPAKYSRHVARTLAIIRQLSAKVESAIAAGRLGGSCEKQVTDALARTRALAESTTF